jgi:prepilin-type processing-associated H-X9-DG protein
MDRDFLGQIERIREAGARNPGRGAQGCLHGKLSTPVSYCYLPYLADTQSKIVEIVMTELAIAEGHLDGPRILVEHIPAEELVVIDKSCLGPIEVYQSASGHIAYQSDLNFGVAAGELDDDGVSRLTGHYPRLREGIARFLVTDINNPAASARAESGLFVMWDAYHVGDTGNPQHLDPPEYDMLCFNHIPTGSNVLFMDGHVEFISLEDRAPLRFKTLSPASLAGQTIDGYTNWHWQLGSLGGFG